MTFPASDEMDPLVNLALIHYQFEAIHPSTGCMTCCRANSSCIDLGRMDCMRSEDSEIGAGRLGMLRHGGLEGPTLSQNNVSTTWTDRHDASTKQHIVDTVSQCVRNVDMSYSESYEQVTNLPAALRNTGWKWT